MKGNFLSRTCGALLLILGFVILAVSGVTFIEIVSGHSFGIDHRMAFNTALSLMLASLVILGVPTVKNKFLAITLQFFIGFIFFLAYSVLLDHLLNINVLFGVPSYNQMSVPAALGLLIVSVGLQAVWSFNHVSFYPWTKKRKTLLFYCLALSLVIYSIGFVGFATIFKATNNLIQQGLLNTLHRSKASFQSTVDRITAQAKQLDQAFKTQSHHDLSEEQWAVLQASGFSGLTVYDAAGHVVHAQGTLIASPLLKTSLQNIPLSATLVWAQGWYLQYSGSFSVNNQSLLTWVAQWPVPELSPLFEKFEGRSQAMLCVSDNSTEAACFPTTTIHTPFKISLHSQNGTPLPMYFALQGKEGITAYPQNNMISAYSALNQPGLGIVQDVNISNLYAPLRMNLTRIIAWTVVIIMLIVVLVNFLTRVIFQRAFVSEVEVQRQKNKLQEIEEGFQLAFDHAAIGMALMNLEGRWIKVNAAFCELTGYTETELFRLSFKSMTYKKDDQVDAKQMAQLLAGSIDHYRVEKRCYCKGNRVIWVLFSVSLVRDAAGAPVYFIVQMQDISSQKKSAEELLYQAQHDALTDVANRACLAYELDRALADAKRRQTMVAILFIDLDYFKQINQMLGREVGDALLIHAADCLKRCVRVTDTVARVGSDEFAVISADFTDVESVTSLAQRVIDTLLEPAVIKGHKLTVIVSIGISLYPQDGIDGASLIKHADAALNTLKNSGKNTYHFYKEPSV